MSIASIRSALTAVAFLVACGGYQAPVPVVGQEADVSQLAGAWFGDYSRVESGRSGQSRDVQQGQWQVVRQKPTP